jgi:biotin carboxyl carrier protein
MLGGAGQSIGLCAPEFRRLRARSRGARVALEGAGPTVEGSVESLDDGRYRVDAGSGARELELIREGDRLQIIGAQATEIGIAPPWPHVPSAEDADAHPASPLPGRVVELRVREGDAVTKGDVLAVIEGMKMQHSIRAGRAGRVLKVLARKGELVDAEAVLFEVQPA